MASPYLKYFYICIYFKAWTDAILDGVNTLFGPSCDYSLAAVAR